MKSHIQTLIACVLCLAAGALATYREPPAVEAAPVSVGPPPDLTLGLVRSDCKGGVCENCICPGDGRCERQECDVKEPVAAAPVFTQPQPVAAKPAVQQSYSSCANGSCSVGTSRRFRIFGRRR